MNYITFRNKHTNNLFLDLPPSFYVTIGFIRVHLLISTQADSFCIYENKKRLRIWTLNPLSKTKALSFFCVLSAGNGD